MEQKKRIPELDVLRGICILGMIVIHFAFDLYYFGNVPLTPGRWFHAMGKYGHIFFILISGICATLGSRTFQRGVAVFGAGLLVSYVTFFGDLVLGMDGLRIWFGILHLLGISMMLYPLLSRFPNWLMCVSAAAIIALGIWFEEITVSVPFLFPLGLCGTQVTIGSDYFPLFPNLGWFLLGIFLGRILYSRRETRLLRIPWDWKLFRCLSWVGRHSLPVYLLHQVVLVPISLLF